MGVRLRVLKVTVLVLFGVLTAELIRKRRHGRRDISRKKNSHIPGFYEKYIKRPLDMLFAAVILTLFAPIIGITALLVRIKLGSPVLFIQDRPGLNGKTFKLYKFRTMTDEKDKNGEPLPDQVRLTDFGKGLRSTSLDELPELFNILKGDMSMVGPRPLLAEYLPLYSKEQMHRHDVRPGLTGLAQIRGRNAISWEEKFFWDVTYVRNISFRMDWMILIRTIGIVLRREGIQSQRSVTMEAFRGNE